MGQEGPSQPHPNHQEEADKDDAGFHSWRGVRGERLGTVAGAEGSTLSKEVCGAVKPCRLQERGMGAQNRTEGKVMGLAKGGKVILGNVKKLPKGLQGVPNTGVLHKPGVSEEDLEGPPTGVTG